MQPTQLFRGVVGSHYGLDVTAQSAQLFAAKLAPSWKMVMAAKRKRIPWEVFRQQYEQLLDMNWQLYHREILETLDHASLEYSVDLAPQLHLLCYCQEGKDRCHAELLIDWLCENAPHAFVRGGSAATFPDLSLLEGGL